MKKFIKQIIIFCSIPFIYFSLIGIINIFQFTHQKPLLKGRKILIAGDSHPKTSLNPQFFNSAQNISQYGEPYILTFWKLKKIFQTYLPDTLILGFAPHNISEFNDFKFSNDRWSNEMFRRCYPIENFKEIDDKIEVDYSNYFKTLWIQICFFPKKNHINYIGNYSNKQVSNPKNWERAIKRHYYLKDQILGTSAIAVGYLDSIITICRNNDVDVILESNPVHDNYFNNIPSRIMEGFYQLKEKYKKQLTIIDHTQNTTYPDSLFRNPDHLNTFGANRFTQEVIDILNSTPSKH